MVLFNKKQKPGARRGFLGEKDKEKKVLFWH